MMLGLPSITRVINAGNPVNRSAPLNRGLLAWYLATPRLPNCWGTGTWRDLCGRYPGTLTNMDPATDWVIGSNVAHGAVSLDGSNDYVSCGTTLNSPNANISITAWVRSTVASGEQYVINKNYDGSVVPFSLQIGGGAMDHRGFGFYNGFWSNSGIATDIRGDGTWHHVAGTWDGYTAYYYLDGILNASTPLGTTRPLGGSGDVTIGAYLNDSLYLTGDVNDVRFYDRCLTALEIYDLRMAAYRRYERELNWYSSQAWLLDAAATPPASTSRLLALLGVGV